MRFMKKTYLAWSEGTLNATLIYGNVEKKSVFICYYRKGKQFKLSTGFLYDKKKNKNMIKYNL